VIAFDGGLSARKALDFVITHPHLHGCDVHIVLVNADEAQRQSAIVALQRLNELSVIAQMHDMNGRPDEVIASFVQAHDAQLLLMGAYSHSPVRNLFIGSTTTAILTHCPASILLFR
jgi:nucleotide-binding universal stress UspA family protein